MSLSARVEVSTQIALLSGSALTRKNDMFMMRMSSLSYCFARSVLLLCVAFAVTNALGFDAAKPAGTLEGAQASSEKQDGRETANQPNAPSVKRVDNEYIIGPSNVLAITVWKDAELTRTVPVRPDGRISLPLIGELEVSGLTALAVQHMVAEKLKEFVSDPQVNVIVQEVKSRTYSVLGKIAKPGAYELGKPTTVLQAIAIAGGFLDFAKQSKVYIIRPVRGGADQMLPFDYKKVIKGHNLEQNVELQSGDPLWFHREMLRTLILFSMFLMLFSNGFGETASPLGDMQVQGAAFGDGGQPRAGEGVLSTLRPPMEMKWTGLTPATNQWPDLADLDAVHAGNEKSGEWAFIKGWLNRWEGEGAPSVKESPQFFWASPFTPL